MNHILNYFCKLAQERLNSRVIDINNKRGELKSKDKIGLHKHLKKMSCTSIYKNKPVIIKRILNEDYSNLKKLLTITVAESLMGNMKLNPNANTYAADTNTRKELKQANMEFSSVSEVFWGNSEEIMNSDSEIYYNFILNFCLDFLEDESTRLIMNKNLMEYIPYASYISYEDAIKDSDDSSLTSFLIGESYRYANIDVFGEAVYYFSKSIKAKEIASLFVECINSIVEFDSKDNTGRYQKKFEIVYFKNFQDVFKQNLYKFSDIISSPDNDLGERVYNIITEDCKLISEITHAEMSGFMEERYLTVTEKPLYDVYRRLSVANSNYINELIVFQKNLEGRIEEEYFDKKPFGEYKSQYYCEERFLDLCSRREEQMKFETNITDN